jgi:hypothetical protein
MKSTAGSVNQASQMVNQASAEVVSVRAQVVVGGRLRSRGMRKSRSDKVVGIYCTSLS